MEVAPWKLTGGSTFCPMTRSAPGHVISHLQREAQRHSTSTHNRCLSEKLLWITQATFICRFWSASDCFLTESSRLKTIKSDTNVNKRQKRVNTSQPDIIHAHFTQRLARCAEATPLSSSTTVYRYRCLHNYWYAHRHTQTQTHTHTQPHRHI